MIVMCRVVLVCCIISLLGAAGFPLSRTPHAEPRKTRSAEGKRPFYHPYIKQLYEKITYRNGSIIKGNIGNDPVTIWSFLDIGKQSTSPAVFACGYKTYTAVD